MTSLVFYSHILTCPLRFYTVFCHFVCSLLAKFSAKTLPMAICLSLSISSCSRVAICVFWKLSCALEDSLICRSNASLLDNYSLSSAFSDCNYYVRIS